ncbi:MAG TPA: hydrogenase nickel incorporation protein HypB [Plasticicumulans sp.]|uniref:hydrogenase nickel incorporation protein HypB n=1 Tax=Plasticicumulans sp. TaxID=2307179 RepID=UPI002C2FB763|nr:hydrogenase nickel incorporation protein HypB [Plasticicumulans sp.]HMW30987.1 hydrogenase nickel incorporation protein HypB [Plasticicumulans sp.]
MCTVCGCGAGELRIDGLAPLAPAAAAPLAVDGLRLRMAGDLSKQGQPSPSPAAPASKQDLHFGHGPAGVHVGGVEQGRLVQLELDILAKNNDFAARNRRWFAAHGVHALNLVSSPGSGKTTLLCATIRRLAGERALAVIEGDQQTANDAERIRATGAPAVQINTGKGCHLDADMIARALPRLPLDPGTLLFIENVGNLVCPAAFDLGEAAKVAILSVTEGEDKPLKYPDIFAAASLVLLNKSDLLPHLDFDLEYALDCLRRVNPRAPVLSVSAKTGEGLDAWLAWLRTPAPVAEG